MYPPTKDTESQLAWAERGVQAWGALLRGSKWAHLQCCSNKMCKKCCVDKSIRATNQCKCKDHAKAAKAKKVRDKMVEQEILMEGVVLNVTEE
eukprot:scaffold154396_cov73-Cyclotella_meneghiniana.AAC.1